MRWQDRQVNKLLNLPLSFVGPFVNRFQLLNFWIARSNNITLREIKEEA